MPDAVTGFVPARTAVERIAVRPRYALPTKTARVRNPAGASPSTREGILGSIVTDAAQARVAAGNSGGLSVEAMIGTFYSRYLALINITSVLLQLVVVSRVVKSAIA